MVNTGVIAIYGVPERVLPLVGIPHGARVRFRFRQGRLAQVFVRHNGDTSHAVPVIPKGQTLKTATHWEILEVGRNAYGGYIAGL